MKYVINVLDDIPDAINYVHNVMNDTIEGSVCPYCEVTRFVKAGVVVICEKTKTGYKFTVYKDKNDNTI